MPEPVVDPSDIALLLNDDEINVERAAVIIADAQALCEAVCNGPVPAGIGPVVVKRVATRAYVNIMSSRQRQQLDAGSPYAGTMGGGVMLTDEDRADLLGQEESGAPEAFAIKLHAGGPSYAFDSELGYRRDCGFFW